VKATITLFALLAVILLLGCRAPAPHRGYSGLPATDIVVTVTCSEPGIGFAGTIVCDGRSEALSGTGRGTFGVTGHEFVCCFHKTGDGGRISISVAEAGQELGNSWTPKRSGGVRAELLRTPTAQHTIFTTY
jgi:hypothetical protein